jgi:tRNA-2-methylthio-N6-dimethylallyladenosine synthase
VVPYVRGRERSVPPADIIREVRELAARGVKEIVLLGQTVNAYRFDEVGFGELLRMVAAEDSVERIRFTSPHPSDMSPAVIEAMASEPKVQPYLHLPLQSGSDRVLATMERGYTAAEYLDLVARVRGNRDCHHWASRRRMTFARPRSNAHGRLRQTHLQIPSDGQRGREAAAAEQVIRWEASSLALYRATVGHEFPVLVELTCEARYRVLAGPQYKTATPSAGVTAGDTVMVRVASATLLPVIISR